ncbi:DUF4112 domain-containing protein [Propioniciclava sp. MC1683]|uniref:DUF4112 domain-containing protein n=1 Tax=Propioniciclava sp. MC1683 TaxID=2760309 RepID=UPI0016047823|nr:DUF4112 domain-containing protein [Propioniciclava sp. MC1683]MBB1501842.1 DUF4112 domain-containing protein [Propioniciclava sp. MC1683]
MSTRPSRATETQRVYPEIATSRTLARFSDDLVKIPGTDIGIGADALVGLIPGIGDIVGTGLSSAIMVDAVRQRVPIPVLARMGWNLLVDTGLGFVPVVGDAADVMHRANRKNYRLLEKCVAEGRHVDVSAKGYLGLAVATVVGFVLVSLVLVGLLIWGIVSGIGAIVT